ncbi:T9SS type A sorting domain-containing protein [Psychroserpens sp.]|uniref:T9SS type A sorting domain-containing protein n=1 Tax=Psychroserpens sp. TaxID=2020870 RepID=UPI003C721E68
MKKITFLLSLLVVTAGFSQSLPLDFEDPLDDNFGAFNGATVGVVTDPTDAANQVLELVSNGVDFDGAALNLGTYIDLSDDSNNTMTLRFWAPDATTRTHLLKLEGAGPPEAATELYFDTTVSGWQTITLDFGANLSVDYSILVLFADAGPSNTATGTYYIDDITGTNGADVPVDPIPAEAAPIPNVPDGEVYSIFNDTNGFTTVFPVAYDFGTNFGVPDLDPSAAVNTAYKFNFGVAGWGQGEGGPDDVSAYDNVTFQYWAGPMVVGFDFVLIGNVGGTVTEHVYKIGVNEPVVNETWNLVQIPMSFFTGIGFDDTALFQWKVSPLNNSVDNDGIVYLDNILLTQNVLSVNEVSEFSFKVFPNPTLNNWNVESNSIISAITVYDILGKKVSTSSPNSSTAEISTTNLKTGLYFAKIESDSGSKTVKLIKE